MDYDKLERAICNAEKAAREYANIDDGGTCNFDTPIIKIDKANKKRLAEMDWRVVPVDGKIWKGWYFVFIDLHGQGARRTKMAEVAAESLKNEGFDAAVFYEMD